MSSSAIRLSRSNRARAARWEFSHTYADAKAVIVNRLPSTSQGAIAPGVILRGAIRYARLAQFRPARRPLFQAH